MYPVIGDVLGLEIRSYGLLGAVGVAMALVVAVRLGLRVGLERRRLVDGALWCLLCGLLGAKLWAVVVDFGEHVADPWAWVEILGLQLRLPRVLLLWQGGLVYYGGLAGGLVAAALYARSRAGSRSGARALPFSFASFADAAAPAIALGHAWGRLGCFLAGCCFGKAVARGPGVSFGPGSHGFDAHGASGLLLPPASATYPLSPVQLYEAAVELVLAGGLLLLWPRRRFAGQLVLAYLACYSAARVVLELFRGDRGRGYAGDPVALVSLNRWLGLDGGSPTLLSIDQLVGILTVLACVWIWLLTAHRRTRRARGTRP